jgi:hypothetical protein
MLQFSFSPWPGVPTEQCTSKGELAGQGSDHGDRKRGCFFNPAPFYFTFPGNYFPSFINWTVTWSLPCTNSAMYTPG